MGCTIDHLQSDHRVRVLQDFRDARGAQHRTGETAIIRRMDLDWDRNELFIEWEREDGAKETLFFSQAAKEGPRNGHMREFFEKEERVPLPEYTLQGRARRRTLELRQAIPVLIEEPVTDPSRYADAVGRIWALAARRRFVEAEQQVRVVLSHPAADRLEQLAGDLVAMATAHTLDEDGTVYDWLRERAISLWYAWGSRATSGGEGAVMSVRIRAAEARLPARPPT